MSRRPVLSSRVLDGLMLIAGMSEADMDADPERFEDSDDKIQKRSGENARMAIQWIRRMRAHRAARAS